MIKTFKDAETEKIYQRECSRKLPPDIQQVALRKLRMVNNSINLNDLRISLPPIDSKSWVAIAQDSIASELTINGEFVLSGVVAMRLMLKSRITIRRSKHDE